MDAAELAVLEALADPRVAPAEAGLATELALHFPGAALPGGPPAGDVATLLAEARRGRRIEWAASSHTQGELLDSFAAQCRDELDDVTVLEAGPEALELAWRRERARIELRAGFLFCERLAGGEPLLLLGELGPAVVARLLDDPGLRARLAVYDLARLEKVNAVRSSVFVHFEWFLRDVYGVKLLPAEEFTRGLVQRGIISLGMG